MKRLLFISISAVLMLISFVSCTDDKIVGVVPVWGDMNLDPATCYIGKDDSVTIRVSVAKKSEHAQNCTYFYRMKGGKYTQAKDVYTVAPGTVEPTVKMAVPDSAGVYTITFSTSNIYFNADLPNGTIAASTNSVSATLTVIDPNPAPEEEVE